MEIKTISVDQINPAPYNPRLDLQPGDPDYEKLKNSIDAFGFVEPLVWNKRTGNLVGGHQRFKILLNELERSEVEVSVVDLDDNDEKALNIALNKIEGDWDREILKDVLQDLDTGDYDMELTGFDMSEIEDLMTEFHIDGEDEEDVEEDDFDAEAEAEKIEEPITQLGDIWKLGRHRLMCGDGTKIEDVEILLNGRNIDLFYTDPPYGIDVVQGGKIGGDKPFGKKGTVGGNNVVKANEYEPIIGDNTTEAAEKSYLISKEIGIENHIIWGGNYFTSFLPPSRCWIVWDKENTGNFADGEMAWTSYDKSMRIFRHLWNGMIKGSEKGQKRVHPTQKPIALGVWCFNNIAKECETVLDLFGGSGSTLLSCEETGRDCYMMELTPVYCDVIVKRWEEFTGETAVKVKG